MYPPHTLGLYLKIFSNILWKNYEWFIKILRINFLPSLITHQHMCESTHIVNKHWPWRVYTHHINTCILKSAPSYTSDSFTDDGTLYLKKESAISHMTILWCFNIEGLYQDTEVYQYTGIVSGYCGVSI